MEIPFTLRLLVKITLNPLFVVNTCITLGDWLVLNITCILTDRVVVKVNVIDWLVVNISPLLGCRWSRLLLLIYVHDL